MDGLPRIGAEPKNGSRLPFWMYWVYWSLFSVFLATLLAWAWTGRNSGKHTAPAASRHGSNPSQQRSALAGRVLFPYSIIPGGVQSAQELKNAIAHDALVAGQFADFDMTKARIVRLARDREVYVAYRRGDRVYWTKEKQKLLKGETIITDGKHEARTRCGNMISESPSEPVSATEPPAEAREAVPDPDLYALNNEALEAPPISPASLIPPLQSPPENPPPDVLDPPSFPILGGGPPSPSPFSPPPPPPVTTPEPDTLVLLAAGVATCLSLGLGQPGRRRARLASHETKSLKT